MAKANVKLYNGTLADANATLYTTPASTQTIIKTISLCNKTTSAVTVTLKFDSTYFLYEFSIDANTTYSVSAVDQILDTGDLIEGNSDTAASVDCIISGYQIDI